MNYRECYEWGRQSLKAAGIEEADLDARLLLETICHTDRNTLLVHGDRQVSHEEESAYNDWISRRARHIPLQHITGEQEFMGLTFLVNEHVLIPRQDTEILVEEVLKESQGREGLRVLDMCTGSGCILISLLKNMKKAIGTGADLSCRALKVAEKNGTDLGVSPQWIHSDLFEHIQGTYDVIVSNPPYIPSQVIEGLMEEVRLYEPRMALDGHEDGLYFYREITRLAGEYLSPRGLLAFEIGYDQGKAVAGLMEEQGFERIRVVKDLAGLDRVVIGRKNQEEKYV